MSSRCGGHMTVHIGISSMNARLPLSGPTGGLVGLPVLLRGCGGVCVGRWRGERRHGCRGVLAGALVDGTVCSSGGAETHGAHGTCAFVCVSTTLRVRSR